MKFTFTDKAKKYIEDKKIDKIMITTNTSSRNSCCGVGTVDFDIHRDFDKEPEKFKKEVNENLEIFYSPALSYYFKDDDLVNISSLGLGKFKKLYVTNEVNVLAN
jgi:hypothetical protein